MDWNLAMTEPAADPCAAFRERLHAMRAELVAAMVHDGYSAGMGATPAGVPAALDALDTVIPPAGDAVPPAENRTASHNTKRSL
jgi:hypothetical protein